MNRVDPLFPVGKTRLETVGVVGCAVIMSVATLEVCGWPSRLPHSASACATHAWLRRRSGLLTVLCELCCRSFSSQLRRCSLAWPRVRDVEYLLQHGSCRHFDKGLHADPFVLSTPATLPARSWRVAF